MSDATSSEHSSWLAYFPPTFFGAVMGVSGLGLAWRQAERLIGFSTLPGDIILIIGALILLIASLIYAVKMMRHPAALQADIAHPVKSAFLSAFPVALILQVSALAPIHLEVAEILWLIGAPASLLVNFYVFSRWYLVGEGVTRINSLWLIPAAGSFLIAMAGKHVGYDEAAWFFFAIGVLFGGSLLIITIYRYIAEPILPDPLIPTYFVPIVPPGLMSIIYPMLTNWQMGDEISSFVRITFYFALFMLLFNLAMIRIFWRLKFSMGWWAYTFPLDTISAAMIIYAHATNNALMMEFGSILLHVSSFIILYILARTLIEIARGTVIAPD
ncbi:MAG: hypothetical protein HN731_10155 [Rhodospirillaceae bacterium]|jgi:tellurite resistance protein|nr:hypothetical protein [Rhodospirillaceae bacterium]